MRRILLFVVSLWLLPLVAAEAQDTSWTQQPSGSSQWLQGVHFPNKFDGWAVGTEGTILRTTDQGTTWSLQSSGTTAELHTVAFRDSLTGLAAGGCVSCTEGVILKTTDGGQHWEIKDAGHSIISITFSSQTNAWAVGCEGLILSSTDAGETWNQLSLQDVFSCLSTVTFSGDSSGWIGGYVPGILLRTTDAGGTWTQLADSIDPQQDIDAVHFLDRERGWFTGYGFTDTSTVGVIKSTTDGGLSWTNQESGVMDAILSVGFADAARGWAISSTGTILGTGDGGMHWAPEPAPPTTGLEKIAVRPTEGAWIVGLDGMVLQKDLGGLVPVRLVQTTLGWNIVSVPTIVLNSDASVVFPGTASLPYYYASGVGYGIGSSLQNGVGYWLKVNQPTNYSEIGGVLDSLTISAEASWNLIGSISDVIPLSNVMTVPSGAITSIFSYTAGSYTIPTSLEPGKGYWVKCSQACTIMMYRNAPGGMPSGTFVNPAQLRTDELPPPAPGDAPTRLASAVLPATFALHQNFPNPFNPATTVSFDLPEAAEVSLSVYSMLGQEVATIATGHLEGGSYTYQWSAAGELPSGVYMCKIVALSPQSAKSHSQIMKMMLLK